MKRLLSVLIIFLLSFSVFAADKTFALVLSGGGAKGIAEIEILKELDRRGLYPDYVLGTSVGALVGAFYAAGYSGEDLEALIRGTDMMDLFLHVYSRSGNYMMEGGRETPASNLITLDFSSDAIGAANGIIDDQYVASFFRSNLIKVLGINDFDELSIPYRAVGTDLESGEEIVYSDGSLYNAMRGSMAIPIVFTPGKTEDGRYVVDGGMVNNMPSDIARAMGADIVLAVDLNDVQREHNEGQLYYDIDTLTGVAFQVLDLVTSPNTVERYPLSDYVIIPDIAEIGVLDFYKGDEIFEIGKKTVEDNIEVFDQIEQALKGRKKERPLSYSERPYFVIESIITPPSFNHYRYLLSPLSGEVADYETIMRLEEILIYIKQEEGFKSIGYTVEDGKIIIKAEPFSHLTSSVSIGLGMDAGIKGSIEEGRPSLFYFKPHASVFFDINLPEYYGTLIAGLDITNYTALFASYYYNFASSSFSAFASARVGVGDLSMLSIADYLNRMDTSDFLFSAEGGVAYDYMNRLRLELSLDLDLISLGSLKSFDDVNKVRARMVYFDPKVNFNLKYRLLDSKNLYSNGIDIDFDCDLYLRSPFMYDIRLSFESIIPSPVPSSKFIISGKAYVLRGNENIGESYVTGKSGNLSRDYLLLSIGGRVLLSESIYMDVSIFSEGYESRNYPDRFWPRIENAFLVPLSLLNDWAAGFSLSLGFNNEWGNLELFIDITHRGAYSFGVRLK